MPKAALQYFVQKIEGEKPRIERPSDVSDFWDITKPGRYTVTISRVGKPKSQKQLGAHFGLMIASAIAQANDMGLDTSSFLKELVRDDLPSGIGLTSDFLKQLFYCLCPMYRDGKRITLSKASTAEASKHFEECRNLLAAHNIYVEEPNQNWNQSQRS